MTFWVDILKVKIKSPHIFKYEKSKIILFHLLESFRMERSNTNLKINQDYFYIEIF